MMKWNFNGELQENGNRVVTNVANVDSSIISYAKTPATEATIKWSIKEGQLVVEEIILPYIAQNFSPLENKLTSLNESINLLSNRIKALEQRNN